jgi:hypothetical protein
MGKKILSTIVSIVLYCYVLSDIVNYIVRDPFADGPVVGHQVAEAGGRGSKRLTLNYDVRATLTQAL